MTATTCPQCNSARVHRSRRRHPAERILSLLGGSMRRCHDCNSRYARFGGSMVRLTDLRRISERFLLALTMAVAAALILVAIVLLNHSQATPAEDTGRLDTLGRLGHRPAALAAESLSPPDSGFPSPHGAGRISGDPRV